ncbi:FecR family protein [Sunxiuqinia elliptica]|uniref:FecR family protein n=1 Tax=Sunxiuqinia elliptica TaxID=655355 RepID=A0A1I2G8M3_9BACT|nr:FecR domain-containing protein [Sunxiuqinia elliptica]SFF13096.1 FecR family protein [Sunxiuqinia elliptica]
MSQRMDDQHIEFLITRKLSGEAKPEEQAQLEAWICFSEQNRKNFEQIRRIWKNSKRPISSQDVQRALSNVKTTIQKEERHIPKKRLLQRWMQAAAVIAMPLLLALGWYLGNKSIHSVELYSELIAPEGQVAESILADGTHVWLNAGSSLRYDPSFQGNQRNVELIGEGYFKVSKNPEKPFVLKTSKLQVKVLGTSFNVRAYPDENHTEAVLEEGAIEMRLIDYPNQAPVKIKPGESAVYNSEKRNIQIQETDTYLHTAWRDRKFVFKDADLKTIIYHLERFYKVRFHLKNEAMGETHFRGTFEYDQNILDALEAIEQTTSIRFRVEGRDIWME